MPPNDPIDTAERLVRLETKLDFIIKSMEGFTPKHQDFDERINALEKFVNRALGAMVALNILITVFAYKLKGFI